MTRIKFIALALVLGLSGAVYAAGRIQAAARQDHSAHAAGKASCCAARKQEGKKVSCCGEGAACCKDGADCCKAHKAAAWKTAASEDGESCCAAGCCAGRQHKADAQAAVVKVSADQSAESCCSGSDCCKDGACCKGHKAEATAGTKAASADKQEAKGGCGCCGTSCELKTAGR